MYDHGGMNRVYRLIWNRAKRLWVVAPERAKGGGFVVGSIVVAGLSVAASEALADPGPNTLPTGGQVVAGSASISQSGANMTVTQATSRGIINWQSFDIGSSASVEFKQLDASSVTLNRVTQGAGSVIAGKLSANGKVYVVNPNGVLFTKSAQVNVGGLVASTADIANADFMAGKEVFTTNGATGSVINQGIITAGEGGQVVLIGGTISNQGTITARNGNVALAAGSRVTLDAGANGHLKIAVDGATTATLIENGGLISASGGQVLMTAQGASAAVSSVVSNTGTVEAQTIGSKAGKIELLAGMQGGEVKVGGVLDASAPAGGDGGFVETSAAKVSIEPDARVTTLAANGKSGNWLIDPYNVTISTDADSGSGFTATANDTVINVTTLTNALASTGVTITTGTGGSQAGNITVAAPISWSANTTLTLNAAGDIYIDKNITATGNSAGLVLNYGSGKDYHLRGGARITLPGSNSAFSAGGSAFTLIRSLNDLNNVRNATFTNHAIVADIDASATTGWNGGAGFTPISGMSGQFHGLGHVIDGLFINRPGSVNVALIGNTTNIVRDITLSNVNITGGSRVGSILGTASGTTLSNIHATGSVRAMIEQGGGLVGVMDSSTILNSSAAVNVTGVTQTGGLVGRARYSNISDSYATGSVTGTGTFTGGLVGGTDMGGTLARVYASGKVTGTTDVGGLIGGPVAGGLATVTNGYWDSGTTGQPSSYGNEVTSVNARNQATYAGFDFTNTWIMYEGATRPMLRSEHSSVIATPAALQLMAMNLDADYELFANIDFGTMFDAVNGRYAGLWGSNGFAPIGSSATPFTGTYDGKGYSISNLTIARPSASEQGLFGVIGTGGAVKNVRLFSATVSGQSQIGALAGINHGVISGSFSDATVHGGGDDVGNLVGQNSGSITNSFATGSTYGGGSSVGGLVGLNSGVGSLLNTYATGSVDGDGTANNLGGLVGYNTGQATITNSYATGSVLNGQAEANIGGLVGNQNSGTISASFWNTETSGLANGVGTGSATGLAGLDTAGMMALSNFSEAAWSVDDQGGTTSVWRIYDGYTAPMLRSFMTSLTVTGGTATKTYDGSAVSSDVGTLAYSPNPYTAGNVLGTALYIASSANAETYTGSNLMLAGLYSTQFGYDITTTAGTLTIDKATLTVTVADASKTYNGLAFTGGSVSYSGFVNNETAAVLGGTLAFGGTSQGAVNAGSYAITASGLTSDNYAFDYVAGTLTVNKAALTVSANDVTKTYDGRAFTGGSVSYSGFVNNETAANLSGTLTFGGTSQGAVHAGSYNITASGLASQNYAIDYTDGMLEIAKAALIVKAGSQTISVRDNLPPLSFGVEGDGIGQGDSIETIFAGELAVNTAGHKPGSYSITQGTLHLVSDDYELVGFVPGTLIVKANTIGVPTGGTISRAIRSSLPSRPGDLVANDNASLLAADGHPNARRKAFADKKRFLKFASVLFKLDDDN